MLAVIDSPAPPFPKGGGGGRKGPGGPGGGFPGGGFNPASQVQQMGSQQIQQLTGAFNQHDRNRDGRMSQPEFGSMFQSQPMRILNQMIPGQRGGNQQSQISNLFRQITGGKSSFNVNQLLGFASRMMKSPGSPPPMPSPGQNPAQSLLQKLKKPPMKLPRLPFEAAAANAAAAYATNTTSTNTTSTNATVANLQMTLAEAMNQGYVSARFGSNRRTGASTSLLIRVSPTAKASGKNLKLMLEERTLIIPKSRIYTPVQIMGFSNAYPSVYSLGTSGNSSYWPIQVSLMDAGKRIPLGYVDFTLREQ